MVPKEKNPVRLSLMPLQARLLAPSPNPADKEFLVQKMIVVTEILWCSIMLENNIFLAVLALYSYPSRGCVVCNA
jgi:hypothetical protein